MRLLIPTGALNAALLSTFLSRSAGVCAACYLLQWELTMCKFPVAHSPFLCRVWSLARECSLQHSPFLSHSPFRRAPQCSQANISLSSSHNSHSLWTYPSWEFSSIQLLGSGFNSNFVKYSILAALQILCGPASLLEPKPLLETNGCPIFNIIWSRRWPTSASTVFGQSELFLCSLCPLSSTTIVTWGLIRFITLSSFRSFTICIKF